MLGSTSRNALVGSAMSEEDLKWAHARTAIGIAAIGGALAFLWVLFSSVRRIVEIARQNEQKRPRKNLTLSQYRA